MMNHQEILGWLKEKDHDRLKVLWRQADRIRQHYVGRQVHLRGLVEISNHCVRQCGYCGLRAGNTRLERYRMTEAEILACADEARRRGYGTVVIQSGEDYGITADWLHGIIGKIKRNAALAVTLSMGERPDEELRMWRRAGADRYLLRFETSDAELYHLIHPSLPDRISDRIDILRRLRSMGYEIGGGVMIGIPGQTYTSLARDIELFKELDLDMIGIGPYIPHPNTPLGRGQWTREIPKDEQVPATEDMTCRVVALARIVCPEANIPATTALATVNARNGSESALMRGANVLMPELTPHRYRQKYELYPDRVSIQEEPTTQQLGLRRRLETIGRLPGSGPGNRLHFIPQHYGYEITGC
ncbi:MAG: [FeFe] hydrogenase H-cluster radical SAM maturase HydE [Candidatus Abyssubacteria bacterium]